MRVLWITSSYPWEGQPYEGVFFRTQAQALSRQGVELSVLVVVPRLSRMVDWVSPRHALRGAAPPIQVDGGVRVYRIPYFGHRLHAHLGRPHLGMARRVLNRLPFAPDLIHGHYAYPEGGAAVEVGRTLRIPSVITLHGSDVNLHALQRPLGPGRFRRAVAGASCVLCVSRTLQDRARHLAGIEARHLPIGIDLGQFTPGAARTDAKARLGFPPDRPVVLFIGGLLPDKGVRVALAALGHPELQGALGVFVGSGPLGPEIEAHGNCILREAVPNLLVPAFLAAADMLILPSKAEGLPTVLVEAGACGTPVIASAVGGIPELLGEDRGVLIRPGSAEALRSAIQDLLARPQSAQERAERLRLHVREAYDAERNARRLLGIYEDLLDPGRNLDPAGTRSPIPPPPPGATPWP